MEHRLPDRGALLAPETIARQSPDERQAAAISILLVDRDPSSRAAMIDYLTANGCAITATADRNEAERPPVDLIIMDDLLLESGALDRRHAGGARPPTLVLCSTGSEIDRIIALELGADDCVSRDWNLRELLARIRALVRRNTPPGPVGDAGARSLEFVGWTLDLVGHVLFSPAGSVVTLTAVEFRLLQALAGRPRHVMTRERLIAVALTEADVFDRTIDAHICRLRRKLALFGEDEIIRTVQGVGYVFSQPVVRRGQHADQPG
jgi:two-component system OmpR family response regulator